MKPSPIQLTDYFVTDLRLSANPKFDSKQEVQIRFEDFKIVLQAASTDEDKRDWQLILKLTHQPPADANIPYRITAELVGFVVVHPTCPPERIERFVRTNGASMLFGALREVVRDATARGPYSPLILPSTSFYEPEKKAEEPPKPASESKTERLTAQPAPGAQVFSTKTPVAAADVEPPAAPQPGPPAKPTQPKRAARKNPQA